MTPQVSRFQSQKGSIRNDTTIPLHETSHPPYQIPYHTTIRIHSHLPLPLTKSPNDCPRRKKKKRGKKNPSRRALRVWISASHNTTKSPFLSILSDLFLLDDLAQPIPLVFSALIGCCAGEIGSMLRDELLRSKNDEIAYVLILLDSTLFSLSNDTFFYQFSCIGC